MWKGLSVVVNKISPAAARSTYMMQSPYSYAEITELENGIRESNLLE